MIKIIDLQQCYGGIVVTLSGESGRITSDLHYIENVSGDDTGYDYYNVAIDAIESMILAHACAGVKIDSKEYIKGIETAIEACEKNLP